MIYESLLADGASWLHLYTLRELDTQFGHGDDLD